MNGPRHVLETDVLIIGAGPAGCSSAIQLLKQGKRVFIIDRAVFPRHAPGETLHPGIEPLLEHLGVMEHALSLAPLRHKGINSIANNRLHFKPYSETEDWRGFQFPRLDFDYMLVHEANRLGATLFFQESPKEVVRDIGGEIIEVICTNVSIRPSYLIDATGRRRWLAKQFCIKQYNFSPKLLAWYGYVECNNSDSFIIPQFNWNKKGWTWLATVREGLVSWACLDVVLPEKRHVEWLPEQIRHCRPLGKIRVADVTWSIASTLSENNWFLVGDSAFVLDPASSHGILKAIMSGMMVSHLISKHSKFKGSLIHSHYGKWANELFFSDYEELKNMYATYIDGFENHWKL